MSATSAGRLLGTWQRPRAPRISRSYRMRDSFRLLALSLCVLGGVLCPALSAQIDPASLPAHDSHQSLLVAADPYIPAARYKDKFGKHTPFEAGILAIEIYAKNDNDKPIRVNLNTAGLLFAPPGQARQKIAAISPEEVADRVLLKTPRDPKARRLPLPLPGGVIKSGKGKEWDEFASELRSLSLNSDVIPPNATVHGFLFFDIDRHYDLLTSARFELPDLEFMLDKKALFFFEIDLAPAVR